MTGYREDSDMERAKELFYRYHGNRFYMDHDGVEREYDSYHISGETEVQWAEELISCFLDSQLQGREARRAYSAASELIRYDRRVENWDRCLYYPLRAEHLDDVTVLYMLPYSFRMAEKAAGKHCFPKEKADEYVSELDKYISTVQERAENGTLTRAAEYVLQEFSDPVYLTDYLRDLRERWNRLSG